LNDERTTNEERNFMPRVMTVDDSRAVRSIVTKQLQAMGCDIEEAEDGQQALDKLQEISVDLILLDVTMPVMDGPTMLAKLRDGGNATPVVMLTSEAKRSVVAEAMRQGIDDYILKPFKPEELAAKVRKALKLATAAAGETPVESTAGIVAQNSGPTPSQSDAKQFIDVLVIDDMENVSKRLRSLLPEFVTLHGVTSAQAGIAACRDRVCRVVLVDADLPDVNAELLASQLKVLQPHAVLVSLELKSATPVPEVLAKARNSGFGDVLFKPFSPEAMEDFVLQYFDRQDILLREDNVIRLGAFTGKPERLERYFSRVAGLLPQALETIASACFEDVVVDVTKTPTQNDRFLKMIAGVAQQAKSVGLGVRLVGPQDIKKMLSSFEETKALVVFPDVSGARAA
jgi:two-component system, cell cycle response regulator